MDLSIRRFKVCPLGLTVYLDKTALLKCLW